MRDEEFLRNKVPMTKSEVRAISIHKLELRDCQTMLDIGAGTGSVSVQVARDHPALAVTAIERDQAGIDIIQQNMDKFQIQNLQLIKGDAPQDLPNEQFDAIFVGGTGQNMRDIVQYVHDHLRNHGSVVLNFILLENALLAEQLLTEFKFQQIEMAEVSVLRWHALGKGHYFKPNNPTIIISAIKEEN